MIFFTLIASELPDQNNLNFYMWQFPMQVRNQIKELQLDEQALGNMVELYKFLKRTTDWGVSFKQIKNEPKSQRADLINDFLLSWR